MPSAAGLIQLGSSACNSAEKTFGIACEKSYVQFASGMNGDEDMGQDIIMKGDKFHYQQKLAKVLEDCTYTNGTLDANQTEGTTCNAVDQGLMQKKVLEDCTYTNGTLDANQTEGTTCNAVDQGLMQKKVLEDCTYTNGTLDANQTEGTTCNAVDQGLMQKRIAQIALA